MVIQLHTIPEKKVRPIRRFWRGYKIFMNKKSPQLTPFNAGSRGKNVNNIRQ